MRWAWGGSESKLSIASMPIVRSWCQWEENLYQGMPSGMPHLGGNLSSGFSHCSDGMENPSG